ncbi:DUF4190 domain-containing protein [Microbacterium sp. No. 7]|uniref:DUF4190 domain-containing protein n=1 Tax=Microbacterium sp. No. 7 TaxID=1714373 RepID=UPI0006D2A68D|nr:DUF4190 domain-containing protein [Microbacterium sp. No. 7]ALJ22092.1 hypothetical protein AOA12_20260 [Microbacterium sp. No. 7]
MSYQPPVTYVQIQKPPVNGSAIAGMILGIVALAIGIWAPIPFFGLVAGTVAFIPTLLAITFGHIGLAGSKRLNNTGKAQAITGLVLGYLTLAIIAFSSVVWFAFFASGGGS